VTLLVALPMVRMTVAGILTFSEAVNYDLDNKYSKEEFLKAGFEAIQNTCKHMKTELI